MKAYKTSESTRAYARENMRRKRRNAGVPLRKTFKERFWYNTMPITESGCLIWMGYTSKGYGMTSYRGKVQRAHRVAWMETNGEIPKGVVVCHKCDTPSCINPGHLFLGTQKDNITDMINKGRGLLRGSEHAAAKLNEADVRKIKKDNRGPTAISNDYCISPSTVCDIRSGRSWAGVT